MKIINLTPHEIHYRDLTTGETTTYPSEGVARIHYASSRVHDVSSIKIEDYYDFEIVDLPPRGENDTFIYYIVSSLLAMHQAHRADLLAPDTGPSAIRDQNGNVVAITQFARY